MQNAPHDLSGYVGDLVRAAIQAADSHVQPWQADIKPGDYFREPITRGHLGFGRILEEPSAQLVEARNFRRCEHYSSRRSRGEISVVHVSFIERLLTRAEFDEARRRNWTDPDGQELK